MCGGGGFIGHALGTIAEVGTGIFAPELLPLVATGVNLAEGKGLGKSLLAGGEAFLGSELIGAASSAFPETAKSLGLDTGGNTLSDVLGITQSGGSLTGPGTIGGDISKVFSGGSSPTAIPSASSPSAPSLGGGTSAASAAAPAAAASAPAGGDVTGSVLGGDSADPYGLKTAFSTPASNAPSPTIGNGTVGTSNIANDFSAGLGGATGTPIASVAPDAGTGGGSLLDKAGSYIGKAFDKNPLGIAASGIGLGLDALKGQQPLPGEKALSNIAGQEAAQGNQLQSYLDSGALPPGLQQSINQATEAAKATIRSQYASRGMSGSSAEQQDLAAVDSRSQAQGAQMAMQLLQTGINETGMASQLYQAILNESMQKDKDLGSAISSFASAAAGGSPSGGRTITIN